MIKALEYGPLGPTIVIGLTWRNLDLLAAGRPVVFCAAEAGWRGSRLHVLLVGGPTAGSMLADLAVAGLPAPREYDDTDGLLSFTTDLPGPGPAAVLGVGNAADGRLRGGAELTRRLPQITPGLRLIAGSDTDRLAAVITAGKPVREAVDLRGGRTD